MVLKTVNPILSHGLNHRQFQQFLLETQAEFEDLTYFCNVRWLSRGKMLQRFYALREEIATFLIAKTRMSHIFMIHFGFQAWDFWWTLSLI